MTLPCILSNYSNVCQCKVAYYNCLTRLMHMPQQNWCDAGDLNVLLENRQHIHQELLDYAFNPELNRPKLQDLAPPKPMHLERRDREIEHPQSSKERPSAAELAWRETQRRQHWQKRADAISKDDKSANPLYRSHGVHSDARAQQARDPDGWPIQSEDRKINWRAESCGIESSPRRTYGQDLSRLFLLERPRPNASITSQGYQGVEKESWQLKSIAQAVQRRSHPTLTNGHEHDDGNKLHDTWNGSRHTKEKVRSRSPEDLPSYRDLQEQSRHGTSFTRISQENRVDTGWLGESQNQITEPCKVKLNKAQPSKSDKLEQKKKPKKVKFIGVSDDDEEDGVPNLPIPESSQLPEPLSRREGIFRVGRFAISADNKSEAALTGKTKYDWTPSIREEHENPNARDTFIQSLQKTVPTPMKESFRTDKTSSPRHVGNGVHMGSKTCNVVREKTKESCAKVLDSRNDDRDKCERESIADFLQDLVLNGERAVMPMNGSNSHDDVKRSFNSSVSNKSQGSPSQFPGLR